MSATYQPTFSLVMCTMNRADEVDRCIQSLLKQTYSKFELIIVDQNSDDRLTPIIARYSSTIEIRHLRSPTGLSRGRNVGIRDMRGDVLGLPDDDCVYPPDVLQRVRDMLAAHPEWDGVAGSVPDNRHWSRRTGPVTRNRVWWQGVDFTEFFRKRAVDVVGLLDERLGLGSGTPWSAGECGDYLLRCLKNGLTIWYDPSLIVEHPGPTHRDDQVAKEIKKAYSYAMGVGFVLQQHGYPMWYASYMAARPLAGATLSLLTFNPSRAKLYWNVVRGTMRGYFSKCA